MVQHGGAAVDKVARAHKDLGSAALFRVHIVGHAGAEAEFVVHSPVLALDLALRAARAGIAWRAAAVSDEPRPVDLWRLRELAERHASSEPGWAAYLAQIVTAERQASEARLN